MSTGEKIIIQSHHGGVNRYQTTVVQVSASATFHSRSLHYDVNKFFFLVTTTDFLNLVYLDFRFMTVDYHRDVLQSPVWNCGILCPTTPSNASRYQLQAAS
jgi:hypothetical protein